MTTPTIEDTYRELERTSEVINDHLWYVNPEKLRTALTTIDQNARERTIREIISLFEEESNKPQIRHRNYFELLDTLLSHPLNK